METIRRLLGVEGRSDEPFGISVRAPNEWTREAIESRKTIGDHPKALYPYATLMHKKNDSWIPYEPRRRKTLKEPLLDKLREMARDKYQDAFNLNMSQVANWQKLANIIGREYHLVVWSNQYDDTLESSGQKVPKVIFEQTYSPNSV